MKQILFPALVTFSIALAVSGSAQTAAQPAATHDARLDSLAIDLKAISRIATVSKDLDHEKDLLRALVADDIESLRQPNSDGTYRWASLQRIEDGRVKDEKAVEKVSTEQALQNITVTAPRAFRVLVTVPEKRNLVSANSKVYVRNIILDMTGFDGKTTHSEIPVNLWINPKDSHGVALPDIARSATATAELGVETGTTKAVANVALLEAKLVDDPQSPYFPAVQRLHQIEDLIAKKTISRGDLRSVVDEAILSLPGELSQRMAAQQAETDLRKQQIANGQTKGSIAPGDATPDVVNAIGDILRLSGGSLDQQTEARTKLQQLNDSLRPPTPEAPATH